MGGGKKHKRGCEGRKGAEVTTVKWLLKFVHETPQAHMISLVMEYTAFLIGPYTALYCRFFG